tara:strand:+ start:188 stop:577 length:390 start_codon:yes stop_codon:yes gene_type:complete
MDDKVSKLKSIADLRDSGILSEAEFSAEKAKIMSEPSMGSPPPYGAPPPFGGPPPMGQDPPVDDGFRMLMYVLSFLFPIAGIIVGIIYYSKPELHHKDFGKTCLTIAVLTSVLSCICYMISMGAMMSSY